jgi:hypothetical protein
MRNEAFAHCGYQFNEAGTMDRYFFAQKWYRAQHKDVSSFVADLEIMNIRKIRDTKKAK